MSIENIIASNYNKQYAYCIMFHETNIFAVQSVIFKCIYIYIYIKSTQKYFTYSQTLTHILPLVK